MPSGHPSKYTEYQCTYCQKSETIKESLLKQKGKNPFCSPGCVTAHIKATKVVEYIALECTGCNKTFKKVASEYRDVTKRLGRTNFYCSSECAKIPTLPIGREPRFIPPIERFSKFIDVTSSCWNWTGALNLSGYGKFTISYNINSQAHRFSYFIFNGPIPEKSLVRHSCDNRKCVNPDHLELGSCQDNTNDMIKRGRAAFQTGAHKIKLTLGIAREIREKYKTNTCRMIDLAREYDLNVMTISKIINNKTWKEI